MQEVSDEDPTLSQEIINAFWKCLATMIHSKIDHGYHDEMTTKSANLKFLLFLDTNENLMS